MDRNTCISILELEGNASTDEIKKAYKKMELKYHQKRQEQNKSNKERRYP